MILKIKNAKFSGCCLYMKTNIKRDIQIYISVPLKVKFAYDPLVIPVMPGISIYPDLIDGQNFR